MISIGYIDGLIHNDKRAIHWYFGWFASIVFIGVSLIIVSLSTGWIKEIGIAIGSAFVLLLAKPPLSEVLKRRDRVTALNALKTAIAQVSPDSPEASRVEALVWEMLKKMLEG